MFVSYFLDEALEIFGFGYLFAKTSNIKKN